MNQFLLLLLLALLLCFRGNDLVQSTSFTLVNKCSSTVWPGVLSNSGNLGTTGFVLGAGGNQTLKAPAGWRGRFWARTGCKFDGSGRGNCTTGNCGNQIECSDGLSPRATIAEFSLDQYSGQDFYDVSLVDGFNLPLLVEPEGGNGSCSATGCTADLNHTCPAELKPGDGQGCLSACEKFGKPEYCCTGEFQTQDTCQPTNYSKVFKSACPNAYSYAFDDATSTFTCSGANYTITFCTDSITKTMEANITVRPHPESPPPIESPASQEGPPPIEPPASQEGPPPIEPSASQEGPPIDSTSAHSNKSIGKTLAIVFSSVSVVLLLVCIICFRRIIRRRKKKKKRNATIFLEDKSEEKAREDEVQLPTFDFATIAAATDHFSDGNKLGQGGFGPVYKGKLREDQEIAVKRLAKTSQQGASEFRNEVMLIAKLQHRNLVRLLGCCVQGEERMLIYEYMVNKSLDAFLFDTEKAALLDWKTRYQIIIGITHGLLYLHHDSRFRIIHRDLKASNILLDKDMNPKISDFGMARIFGGDETDINTRKVVGTYGYMSPEYALDGNFSMKSDVFSFGVIVLEIISGKKNRGVYAHSPHLNLVAHAWSLWNEGKSSQLLDQSISHSVVMDEAVKCIKIGLLCVQEQAENRPLMKTVIQMFGSDISSLPQPKKPGFIARMEPVELIDPYSLKQTSNEVTFTSLEGR